MSEAKHIVICGHGEGDPGAGANGINERDFIREEIAPLLKKYGGGDIEIFDMSKNCFKETKHGRGIQTLKGKTVTELHLDAAGSSAKGGHIIISEGFSPDEMDKRLANVIGEHFGFRGGKAFHARDNLLNLNTAKKLGINYRLVEICFVTNAGEVAHLKKNADQIAREFAAAITGKTQAAATSGPFRIFTGAFTTPESAEAASGKLTKLTGFKSFPKDKRVWTGTFSTLESARLARDLITDKVGMNPQIRDESTGKNVK